MVETGVVETGVGEDGVGEDGAAAVADGEAVVGGEAGLGGLEAATGTCTTVVRIAVAAWQTLASTVKSAALAPPTDTVETASGWT